MQSYTSDWGCYYSTSMVWQIYTVLVTTSEICCWGLSISSSKTVTLTDCAEICKFEIKHPGRNENSNAAHLLVGIPETEISTIERQVNNIIVVGNLISCSILQLLEMYDTKVTVYYSGLTRFVQILSSTNLLLVLLLKLYTVGPYLASPLCVVVFLSMAMCIVSDATHCSQADCSLLDSPQLTKCFVTSKRMYCITAMRTLGSHHM